jgi:SAM-dependent methyltransferase
VDDALYAQLFEVESRHWWCVGRRRVVARLLKTFLPAGGRTNGVRPPDGSSSRSDAILRPSGRPRVCELGCGTGMTLAELAARYEVVGMDASPAALDYCARRGVPALAGRLPDAVPFAPGSCDAVLMMDVLEHVEADAAAATAAAQVVAPGGVLIAAAPACPWLFTARDTRHGHYRRYTLAAFGRLFRLPGFTIRRLSYLNALLFPLACAFRLLPKPRRWIDETADLAVPPAPINRLFAALFASEGDWLRRAALPIGLSVICVATRNAHPTGQEPPADAHGGAHAPPMGPAPNPH